jgi:ubiquinone/menaquinone biosynthesis C-methylase UbiE
MDQVYTLTGDFSHNRGMRGHRVRLENYSALIRQYFEAATPLYRSGWADSFHLPPFLGDEDIGTAVTAQERRLADEGRFGAGQRILDIGSGVGAPARTIARYSGAEVVGLDITPVQVAVARELAAESGLGDLVSFVEGDAMSIPFDDAEFDAAYSFDALCHTPDKLKVYREVARILKPNGLFLGYDWFCREQMSVDDYEEFIEPVCRTFAIPHLITLSELERSLYDAGFEVESVADASHEGDLARNWEIFEQKGASLALRDGEHESLMRESVEAVARAGRSGAFLIGHWRCRKPQDGYREPRM